MVRAALTLLLLAWMQAGVAAVRLDAQVDRKELVLGESLTLEIRVRDRQDTQSLDALKLDQLQSDYDVRGVSRSRRSTTRRGREETTDIVTVTLYPLRAGQLRIPPLTFLGAASKPIPILVLQSGPSTPRVLIRPSIEPARPLVRQGATLTLDVLDDGSLQWPPMAPITAAGMHLRELPESQREATVDGVKYTVHRHAWSATPLRDGNLIVRFPMLEATKFGARLRYAAPPLMFAADPVPAYLPVHVPVGKPEIGTEPLPDSIAVNRPLNWQLTVRGSGISEEGIAKLLAASLGDSEAMRFYAPKIREEADTSPVRTLHVTLPFQALRSGKLALPEIAIPYYDPRSGRLERLVLPAQVIVVTNPAMQNATRLAMGLWILVLSGWLAHWLGKALHRVRVRRASMRRIAQAADAAELKQALLAFAAGHPATLRQWLAQLSATHGPSARLAGLVQQLEQACYDGAEHAESFARLKAELVDALKHLRPTPRCSLLGTRRKVISFS
jgi:hypothetical protein